nr:MAG TPA: hypothetical protein [Caudoviricetes sp.]
MASFFRQSSSILAICWFVIIQRSNSVHRCAILA